MTAPDNLCHNGRIAVALAEADFFVFPCINKPGHSNHKKPLVQWLDKSTNDSEQVRAWWLAEYRYAMPGLDLSKSGLIAVDGDLHHEGQDGPASIEMILGQKLSDIGCPVVVTPSGGVHAYFLQPRLPDGEGSMALGNGTGSLPYGIDIRGHGGYVIAPGAATGDKRLYRRLPGTPDLSDAFHAGTIPYLPDAIVEAIRAGREDKRVVTEIDAPQPRAYAKSGNREGAWGAAALDNELRRIAEAPKGARNNVLASKAFYLGTIAARGWIDPSAAISGMMGAVKGWTDPKKTISTLNRCFTAGLGFPHDDLPDSRDDYAIELGERVRAMILGEAATAESTYTEDGDLIDDETGEVIQPAPDAKPTPPPPPALDYVAQAIEIPGLITEIVHWIMGEAFRPQARLALASAISIAGIAAGRQFVSPTRSRLNTYNLMIADTGVGKEDPLSAPKLCLRAADEIKEMLAPSGANSDVFIFDHLHKYPTRLMCIDEIGDALAANASAHAPAHLKKVNGALKELWSARIASAPGAMIRTPTHTVNPFLSILAASTPAKFFNAVGAAEAEDGTLNRFCLFMVEAPSKKFRHDFSSLGEVPEHIIKKINDLAWAYGAIGSIEYHRESGDIKDPPAPHIVPWASDEVRKRYIDYVAWCIEEQDQSEARKLFGPRTAQHAIKLATIFALSESCEYADSAKVEMKHLEIGQLIAETSYEDMARRYDEHMPAQGVDLVKRALSVIKKANPKPVAHSHMVKLFTRNGGAKTVREIMATLIESGEVQEGKIKGKRGPAGRVYVLKRPE